tara:strand:- start:75 stop:683 length:609 start_codon:yes stop_codon:yes gene_type:complete
MTTKTYAELFTLIKSLAGVNSFTDEEAAYIKSFANRRFYEIYESSLYWSRYLVVGEARTLTTNTSIVPYSQSSLNTIHDFIRIHRKQPLVEDSVQDYSFYVTASGAHIINIDSDVTSPFVTYKYNFTEIANDESTIPYEFFNFIAHASYSDFLRMDGQTEKALVEEQIANDYKDIELGKVDSLSNSNFVVRKISTYVNSQAR